MNSVQRLRSSGTAGRSAGFVLAIGSLVSAMPALAALGLDGQVLGGGVPVANSTVTLWAATSGAPAQLGQAKTGADGRFTIDGAAAPAKDASVYLVARGGTPAASKADGDNPAIALLAVLGSKAPAKVTINEMTTVASVITHNQFIDGTAVKDSAVALRIAAANVPNFVDLSTGDYGPTISDALNSAGGSTNPLLPFALHWRQCAIQQPLGRMP